MRTPTLAVAALLTFASPALAAPQVTIDSGPPELTNSRDAHFSFTVTENGKATCQIDTQASTPCTSPVAYGELGEGAHTFRVRTGDFEDTHAWTIDVTPPDTAFTKAPPSPSADRAPVFELSSESGASFECSSNGLPFEPCASPIAAGRVHEGKNLFRARAVDPAGNADLTPAAYEWIADLTAPPVAFSITPANVSVFAPAAPDLSAPVPLPGANPIGAIAPRIVLDAKPTLEWRTEPGAKVSFSLQRRRELRSHSVAICYLGCTYFIDSAYPDAIHHTIVKDQPPGKSSASIERGRSMCVAGFGRDAVGNQSETPPKFSCVTRPFAMTSTRFKPRNTKRVPDPSAYGGASITLKPGTKTKPIRIDMLGLGKTKTGDLPTATWMPSLAVVGRSCKDCGSVTVRIKALRTKLRDAVVPGYASEYGFVFEPAPDVVRKLSLKGSSRAQAIKSVFLPPGTWATELRLTASGRPVEISGLAIPNPGGLWYPDVNPAKPFG